MAKPKKPPSVESVLLAEGYEYPRDAILAVREGRETYSALGVGSSAFVFPVPEYWRERIEKAIRKVGEA